MKSRAQSIRDLEGLGPKSEEMLARAGITTVEELQEIGAVVAFVRARRADPGVSLNLLWGLEAALSGLPWQEVARKYRTSLLLAVEAYERETDQLTESHRP